MVIILSCIREAGAALYPVNGQRRLTEVEQGEGRAELGKERAGGMTLVGKCVHLVQATCTTCHPLQQQQARPL